MAVIREDVVSIGFDVENNPFAELTTGINEIKAALGILDETESGLRDVGREASRASGELGSLGDSIHAPPANALVEPLREAREEAGGLTDEIREAGETDASGGVRRLIPKADSVS